MTFKRTIINWKVNPGYLELLVGQGGRPWTSKTLFRWSG